MRARQGKGSMAGHRLTAAPGHAAETWQGNRGRREAASVPLLSKREAAAAQRAPLLRKFSGSRDLIGDRTETARGYLCSVLG